MSAARQCPVHNLIESFHSTLKRKPLCGNTYTNMDRSTNCYETFVR